MYLNPTPTGFNLGEKLDYERVLRESERGRGGTPLKSQHISFPDHAEARALIIVRLTIVLMLCEGGDD